jgi:hypothetical protein
LIRSLLLIVAIALPAHCVSPDDLILDMLRNVHSQGINRNPAVNHGLGGLWINWRYGSSPLQTNFKGSGPSPEDWLEISGIPSRKKRTDIVVESALIESNESLRRSLALS